MYYQLRRCKRHNDNKFNILIFLKIMDYNKTILIGRAGKDPVLRDTGNGVKLEFTIATNKFFRKKGVSESETDFNKAWDTRTSWHNIIVWGNLAEMIKDRIKKGDCVFVEGELGYNTFLNKEGKKVIIAQVNASRVKPINIKKSEKKWDKNFNQEQVQQEVTQQQEEVLPF